MTNLLLRWLVGALALLLVAYVVPGIVVAEFFPTAVVAALALGLVNAVIAPIVKALTLPITCLTLGLFSLVVNTLLFWGVAAVVDGFDVTGIVAALIGSLLYSLTTAAAGAVLK